MQENILLEHIKSPDDIKDLTFTQLNELCEEIRNKLINTISVNGGHLASNLGVVELTVALHKVFNTPIDQIVWDVSHQCYTHKLLTGRYDDFDTIRKLDGLCGFTKPCESVHDAYGAGHSSTSISAAVGLARAKTIKKEDGYVIAVIGDGALTGGLAYEGINNAGRSSAGRSRDKLICILNDNEMSISKNVGAIARHLAVIRANPLYFRIKDDIEILVSRIPFVGEKLRKLIFKIKSIIKNSLYNSTIFEEMGLDYLGPADGHNIEEICSLLKRAKAINRPVLIHLMTTKGKGYSFAEQNPKGFHGVGNFDIQTGDLEVGKTSKGSFSDVFGDTLVELAQKDNRICAITASMASGTGLSEFAAKFKTRFFDVGIAEEHATVFAAGLATNGLLPVFAVYSSFLQRAYDQILHDVALQNLKVIFAIDRAGLVGEDGETHQGVFDVAFLNSIPNITIFSPTYYSELRFFLEHALLSCNGPVAIRYPRGNETEIPLNLKQKISTYNFYNSENKQILIITYGRLFSEAAQATTLLEKENIHPAILKLNCLKPISDDCYKIATQFNKILFFEEGIKAGGIGEHFGTYLIENGYKGNYKVFAIDDIFVKQGSVKQLLAILKLDAEGIKQTVLEETITSETVFIKTMVPDKISN
jgi:1-deoxy-D-xylulose-5-phosphate synthase